MTKASAPSFFDAIAGRYDRVYALPAAESRRRMTRVLGALPSAPARVLDLGVGTGRELGALLDAGFAPTGLDASQFMLDRCARRARPVPLVRADFWAVPLPFADRSFEAVVALHGALAHPPGEDAIEALAADLARIVPAGGVFAAEVPAPGWLDRIASLPQSTDQRIERTGPRTCVYEDLVVGASIEARVLDDAEWRSALGPAWATEVEAIGDLEWLVVGRRT